jgi:glycosyltransferase involved in cell wall biosynthesis
MTPRVSVIMPVRNGGVFLAESVASILSQSMNELELIIVDDHSSDTALAQLDIRDPRVQILPSKGRGVSAAFNTGLAHARGAFLARMDSDDVALPKRLELQLRWLERHPQADICGGCVEIFSDSGIAGGNRRYQDWLNRLRRAEDIRRELFIESPIPNPTAMFRREAILRLGGYLDPAWPEDYDLFLRADALGMQMGKPRETVLHWREHPGRLTRTDKRYSQRSFQAAKAHYLAAGRLRGQNLAIWGAGPGGRLFHDLLHEEGVRIRGFLDVHPRRIGGEKRGLPVWPIEAVSELEDVFIVVAVGAVGARKKIRRFLEESGWVEGERFLFVA